MSDVFVIGVTGGSGSGKSSFVRKLKEAFTANDLTVISQDNYYKPKDRQRKDERGVANFDTPDSIFLDEFAADLKALRSGDAVERVEYVYNNPDATPARIRTEPAPVIIAEGLFMLHDGAIRSQLDLSLFVEVEDAVKLKRRIDRDWKERNYAPEDVIYRFEKHVLPGYRKHIKPYRSLADVIVNNNESMDAALEMITSYIGHLISDLR